MNTKTAPVEEIRDNDDAELQDAKREIERLRVLIAKVLHQRPPITNCRGQSCGRKVFFVFTERGKTAPFDLDGTSHFATCPDRDRFRKSKEKHATTDANDRTAGTADDANND